MRLLLFLLLLLLLLLLIIIIIIIIIITASHLTSQPLARSLRCATKPSCDVTCVSYLIA